MNTDDMSTADLAVALDASLSEAERLRHTISVLLAKQKQYPRVELQGRVMAIKENLKGRVLFGCLLIGNNEANNMLIEVRGLLDILGGVDE